MSIRSSYLSFLVILTLSFVFVNCTTKPEASGPLTPKGYVSYDLAYPDYKVVFEQLQKISARKLKSRGEAHITVITPPEFEKLKTKISPAHIHALASVVLKKAVSFQQVCLGKGEKKIKDQTEKVYFIVVTSPELMNLRRTLAEEGHFNKTEFDPELFFPHITLGFTERDLYYEDGVIKNKTSCPQNLQNLLARP